MHRFVGPAVLRWKGRGSVAGQERNRSVAPVAPVLDPGDHLILLGVGHCELEVFDFVPVMGVGLAHHGLRPLLVDVVVTAGADLGLLVEYLWNDRDDVSIKQYSLDAQGLTEELILLALTNKDPPLTQEEIEYLLLKIDESSILTGETLSPFENDIFIGTRFTLNDVNSTDFLAGFIVDADDHTTSASFEGSTRIGDTVRVTLNIYLFENVDEDSAFYSLRKDDQIEAKIAWYF